MTESLLALRRQIRNLRAMIAKAAGERPSDDPYVERLRTKLAQAEARLSVGKPGYFNSR